MPRWVRGYKLMNTTNYRNTVLLNLEMPNGRPALRRKALILTPGILFVVFAALLALPATRAATMWTLSENHPVEIITFIFLMIGGIYGLNLSRRLKKQGERFGYVLFYALFSLGLLLTGLEEIAWGQQFWGFATPDSLKTINMQGETTLHNIKGFHGHTEVFRLLFGIGGLTGILLTKYSKLTKIGTPLILFSWFGIITAHSMFDVFDDIFVVPKFMVAASSNLAELVEMLIGMAGLLYLYLNSGKFDQEAAESSSAVDQGLN